MCQFNVKVTIEGQLSAQGQGHTKGQIFNKQILHITLCPLDNSFTNGRISFKLEWHIHLN